MQGPSIKLDRPIFLTGCCKSGTTMLGMIFLRHPDVGPKEEETAQFQTTNDGTQALLVDPTFDAIAHQMEQKDVWDRFFPMGNVELRIGRELTLLHNPLSEHDARALIDQLTTHLKERRFFSKHPSNCFRAHALRELFPDAKIIAIHRDGRDVIASWGRKGNRWQRFGGHLNAIEVFARKWNESVDHIEKYRDEVGIEVIRYEDLVQNPTDTLKQLFIKCELDPASMEFDSISLRNEAGLWKLRIPPVFHRRVVKLTDHNLRRLGYEI